MDQRIEFDGSFCLQYFYFTLFRMPVKSKAFVVMYVFIGSVGEYVSSVLIYLRRFGIYMCQACKTTCKINTALTSVYQSFNSDFIFIQLFK
jgi:hypothetical protein